MTRRGIAYIAAGLALAGLGGCAALSGGPDTAGRQDSADALEPTPSAATPEAQLANALALIYADSPYAGQLTYAARVTDLNGDGQDDAVAYVQGPDGCDNGCDLFIFEARDARLVAINRLPLARPPLTRESAKSGAENDADVGWADLTTHVAPEGPDDIQRLRFDGGAYQPAGAGPRGEARDVIPDLRDTQSVPAPAPGD